MYVDFLCKTLVILVGF